MATYNSAENKGKKKSDTPTPHELCDFLYNLLKDKYNEATILDPCCGDRRLTAKFNGNIINYEIKENKDFLIETNKINCDLCICNPPFNIGGRGKVFTPEIFLDKVLELCGTDIPIIMIVPMGFRLNCRKRSKRLAKCRSYYPDITTIISLPLNCFDDTLFHSEIICFNTPFLKPHYFFNF